QRKPLRFNQPERAVGFRSLQITGIACDLPPSQPATSIWLERRVFRPQYRQGTFRDPWHLEELLIAYEPPADDSGRTSEHAAKPLARRPPAHWRASGGGRTDYEIASR